MDSSYSVDLITAQSTRYKSLQVEERSNDTYVNKTTLVGSIHVRMLASFYTTYTQKFNHYIMPYHAHVTLHCLHNTFIALNNRHSLFDNLNPQVKAFRNTIKI